MAERIYGYLFDYKTNLKTDKIYITRTLAMINQTIIMNSYNGMSFSENPNQEPEDTNTLSWQFLITMIVSSIGISLIFYKKKALKRKKELNQ
ncbi:MAG: hypothetical protein HWN80_15690 [Candidatus Lokiarchaeota archaeon]|nr:hypothetical protein [Candidatus Lokiarchaeota archaeon]